MIYRNEAAINWTAPLTLVDARTAIDRGKAFAAVEIPADTEPDVLKGITAHVPIYADATYLFISSKASPQKICIQKS